ncbi:MAG: hypothetical protein IPK07_17890 [Deltaproteobacteria bacterium]|nr:hypothetical protein [Deltaproteobacteria bacterium]
MNRPRAKAWSAVWGLVVGLCVAAAGCGSDGGDATTHGTQVVFDLAALDGTAGYFDFPWPSVLRLREDGRIDLTGFPLPAGPPSLREFIGGYLGQIADTTTGFGTNHGGFFRLTGAIDVATLPFGAEASLTPESSVFLVDVDPASAERGERIPVVVSYQYEPTLYEPSNLLAVAPLLGFPLRPSTRYAMVVTTAVKDVSGAPLVAAPLLARIRAGRSSGDARVARLVDAYEPLWATLRDGDGPRPEDVAAATVFTTRDVVGEMFRIRDWIHANVDVGPPTDLGFEEEYPDFYEFTGHYASPNFQTGTPPYLTQGGEILFDANGDPIVQRTESLRFSVTVPKGAPPAGGWPVVVYAHGTGGDYESLVRREAIDLAQNGLAAIGIDQPIHGTRVESDTDWSFFFFNYLRPVAARDNLRQSAADNVQQMRFVRQLVIPAELHPEGVETRFDAGRVHFMGHSQGGTEGPLFVGAEDEIGCAVMSGSGGGLRVTLLQKTLPVPVVYLVEALAGALGTNELDLFHPLAQILQLFIEEGDPLNYAPYYAKRSRGAPHSVFISDGLLDFQVPYTTVGAHAVATGAPVVGRVYKPIEGMEIAGLEALVPPVSGNVLGADGTRVTLGVVQYPRDGHYALFDNPDATYQYGHFLGSCAAGHPTIPAPP